MQIKAVTVYIKAELKKKRYLRIIY